MKLQFAEESMIEDLVEIWRVCFDEPEDSIDYFFKSRFTKDNCVVCDVNGKAVSALYLLDNKLCINSKEIKSYYVYAAATLPRYRGLGYMSQLVNFANEISVARGVKYSTLFPANENLYSYYESLGYKKFFRTQSITLSNAQMRALLGHGNFDLSNISHSYDAVYHMRSDLCRDYSYCVLWDKNALSYAININKIYGGTTVFSKEGYAVCRKDTAQFLEILEFVVSQRDAQNLLARIYNLFPHCNYRFRLPANFDFFSLKGQILFSGMIKSLEKGYDLPTSDQNIFPYMGLTLD